MIVAKVYFHKPKAGLMKRVAKYCMCKEKQSVLEKTDSVVKKNGTTNKALREESAKQGRMSFSQLLEQDQKFSVPFMTVAFVLPAKLKAEEKKIFQSGKPNPSNIID